MTKHKRETAKITQAPLAAQKERIAYIDFMKGLCIIFIVTNHINGNFMPLDLNRSLMSFRIPMYYFLSGLFFKLYDGFGDFTRHKVNNIVIPLLFFYFLAVAWAFFFKVWPFQLETTIRFDAGRILDIFTDPRFRGTGNWYYNAVLWFLMSLFWVNIIYYALQKWLKGLWLAVAVVAIAAVGYWLGANKIKLPYMLDTSLVALPFFMLGSLVKQHGYLQPGKADKWGPAVLVGVGALVYAWAHYKQQSIDLFQQMLPDWWWLYLVPFASILALFWACKNLPKVPVICYIGRYSIVVLGTHYILLRPVGFVLLYGWYALMPQSMPLYKVQWWWMTLIAVLLLELGVIWVMIRLFPHLTAQKELIRKRG